MADQSKYQPITEEVKQRFIEAGKESVKELCPRIFHGNVYYVLVAGHNEVVDSDSVAVDTDAIKPKERRHDFETILSFKTGF